jgi:hypothetical protein
MDADTINPIKNTADILDANTTSRLPIASIEYKEGCGLAAMCHMLTMNPNAPATRWLAVITPYELNTKPVSA